MTETGAAGKRVRELLDWQRRLRAGQLVYYTWHESAHEPTGNYYASMEAAQFEVDYGREHGDRITIHSLNVHSLQLSKERWKAGLL